MGIGVSVAPVAREDRSVASPAADGARGRARAEAAIDAVGIPVAAVLAALALFGLFVALTVRNPLAVYYQMYRGSFGTWFSFQNTLLRSAPLMLTALAAALPLRLGLVVLGGEGAMVLGGLAAAAAAVGVSGHAPGTVKATMLITGAVVGGLWMAG